MNKELASKFLSSIKHEREQDIQTTSRLLTTLSIQQLVQNGLAINNIHLENIRSGLIGKLYMELGPNLAVSDKIQRGDIKVGDIVLVRPAKTKVNTKTKPKVKKVSEDSNGEQAECSGVVYKMSDTQITIALEESQDVIATTFYSYSKLYILKTTNVVTYNRMESTMRKLSEISSPIQDKIIQYLVNERPFIPNTNSFQNIKSFLNPNLNDSQKTAINFAINNDLTIIHGPPGTGKTFTLIELIQQLLIKNPEERILICGPSNISVDTILERLTPLVPNNLLLRIGHPARLLDSNKRHSLDILSKKNTIVKDISQEIDKLIQENKKLKNYKQRKENWNEIKLLRKDLKKREFKTIKDLIIQSRIVVTTLHGSSSRELCSLYRDDPNFQLFDTLIIDEVSQAMEPQCWIPLIAHQNQFHKLVLAGDNKQLPPTIKTEDDKNVIHNLETTLFDRIIKIFPKRDMVKFLNVQYRMNQKIMEFPSHSMYNGKLLADATVANRLLIDLPTVDATPSEDDDDTKIPLIWYDTQGDEFQETADEATILGSKYNEGEIAIVKEHIENLRSFNVPENSIGVISPYNAQVSHLKKLIHDELKLTDIEISTVDGFQGREKDVIILSLVRSNEKFEVGFLKEERRLNVAMTRPRRQLVVVGNIEVLQRCGNKYLKSWSEWCEENADVRYPNIDDYL
ncbi:BAD_collapsed_G0033820.mRNA.1.CDS.1 [Saccharomyces cerevisiae]|nr:Hcs1p [Saccharomyces cerevisiae YJM554]AJS35263.1 Hcs1p [Saccharomyces cerevisiae YJM555]CAD6634474.1 BJ4_G0007300.mRNA.1.CDS.1 [Saccharomyces cerevisiae]CAI4953007.1 BAD_HP_G0031720.mRNA.1.CDS.1 [Saccharomyces cerevisiae]CAI4954226.1 BAD_HP_G0032560.mRNA.1.CDS.1 [Saccharomyces cerevisiae]